MQYSDGVIYHRSGPIDEHGNIVTRTKRTHPYSYDGFITYRNGENSEITEECYSDRLTQWDYKKCRKLMKKHFKNDGDYYYDRTPPQIEAFLAEYFDKKSVQLIFIMEYCNVSSGYPLWRFALKTTEK